MTAGVACLVAAAEVVEQVLPAAVARLGVVDELAQLHAVNLVALFVAPSQARHVVQRQIGLEEEIPARKIFSENAPRAEEVEGDLEASCGEGRDRLNLVQPW